MVNETDDDEIRDLTEQLLAQLQAIIEDSNDLLRLLDEQRARSENLIQTSEAPQEIETGEDEKP
jgi:hypothetical protein